MTGETLKSELEKDPFVPLRLHLVSGKTLDISMPGKAWLMQHALFIMRDPRGRSDEGYDVVALRNIERLERLNEGGPEPELEVANAQRRSPR